MKLSEFVERFVGHNSTVLLYEERYFIDDDELRTREDKLLWRGMDWQISFNKDDEEYFVNHPEVEKCPYIDYEVVKVMTPQGDEVFHTVDEIGIVVDKVDTEIVKEVLSSVYSESFCQLS